MTATSATIYWLAGTGSLLVLGGLLVPGYRALSWALALGGFALICVAAGIYFRS